MIWDIALSGPFDNYRYPHLEMYFPERVKKSIDKLEVRLIDKDNVEIIYRHMESSLRNKLASEASDEELYATLVEILIVTWAFATMNYSDARKQHIVSDAYLKHFANKIDLVTPKEGGMTKEGSLSFMLHPEKETPKLADFTDYIKGKKPSYSPWMEALLGKFERQYGFFIKDLGFDENTIQDDDNDIGSMLPANHNFSLWEKCALILFVASLKARADSPNVLKDENVNIDSASSEVFGKILPAAELLLNRKWIWLRTGDSMIFPAISRPLVRTIRKANDQHEANENTYFAVLPNLLLVAYTTDPFSIKGVTKGPYYHNIDNKMQWEIENDELNINELLMKQEFLFTNIFRRVYFNEQESNVNSHHERLIIDYWRTCLSDHKRGSRIFWHPHSWVVKYLDTFMVPLKDIVQLPVTQDLWPERLKRPDAAAITGKMKVEMFTYQIETE